MNLNFRLLISSFLAGFFLLTPFAPAQEDPTKDPDLQKMLKEAQDMQDASAPARTPVKMSDLQKQAAAIQEEQRQEELKEKAALQKQLTAPGALSLPAWTPATPQFHQTSSLAKKIVDDEVRVVMTGTSTLTPDQLAEAWVAAIAQKPINHILNTNSSNGDKSTTLFLDSRESAQEKVRMHASRSVGAKITEVEISSPLPKPDENGD
ncbi:MAG: hypothetical protein ACREIF_00795 [Chthoniobacterales bacterium]